MTKKNLNDATGEEISNLFEKLKEDDLIFRCDFSKISKHLLKEFLSVNPFSVDFEILKDTYLEHIGFNENQLVDDSEHEINKMARLKHKDDLLLAIKNEISFHKYICKTYFDLIKEPKEELLSEFLIAQKNITEIDETLLDIQNQMDEIYKRNQVEEIQEKKPILIYYKSHNEKAKEEILNFIKFEVKDYSLNHSYDNSFMSSWLLRSSYNYNYSWNPKSYKPRYPNDLENKFGEMPYSSFLDLCKLYKDDKVGFNSYLSNYILDNDIIFSIGDSIQYHHLLDVRKEIISEATTAYQHGSKIMFANAVPTIIEGILHDLCLLFGENENDLLNEGFQYKLNVLQSHLGYELYYEYYSFRFRLFRNKVAHGRLTKADVDELSDLLLLDLYHICKLVKSDKIKLNHKRFVIHELNSNISKPNFGYLMEYLLLDKIEIPQFYALKSQVDKIEELIVGDTFWAFLETELDKDNEEARHGVYSILKILSSRKPFDKRCTKLFKKSGIKTLNKDLANSYLKYLTRDF